MRYRFIDEVITLELGEPSRIEVAKTFPDGDDAFSGPFGADRVPNSLLVELQAMSGGHLLYHRLERQRLPLLLKVRHCSFEGAARPGERLRARAEVRGVGSAGGDTAVAETTSEVFAGDRRVAAGQFLFVCVSLEGMPRSAAEYLA